MRNYQEQNYKDVVRILRLARRSADKDFVSSLVTELMDTLAGTFAVICAADNCDFARERFFKACGLETED